MATAKKATTTRKKAPAKKATTTRRAPATSKKKKSDSYASFKVASNKGFFNVRPSEQTIYWLIVSLAVLALGLWTVNLQLRVNLIYDHIDEINSSQY